MTAQAKASFLVQGEDGMHPIDVSPITFSVPQHIIVDSVTGTVTVSVGNFPASQTVHVDNFPASQTVSVSNFPATQPVSVAAVLHTIVDSETDRPAQSGNVALTLAARTAGLNSAVVTNKYFRGLLVYLNITAVTATGGLIVRIFSVDPISGGVVQLNASPAAQTAVGLWGYLLYPSAFAAAPGGTSQATNCNLPSQFLIQIGTNNAVSMTYSVNYDLLL